MTMPELMITGGAGEEQFYILNDDGTITLQKFDRSNLEVAPSGSYKLKVIGIAPTWMGAAFNAKPDDPLVAKTRMLVEITGAEQELEGWVGQLTSFMLGADKVSPRSTLGQIYMATTGAQIAQGRPVNVLESIGKEFRATMTEKVGTNGTYQGLDHNSPKAPAGAGGRAPAAAPRKPAASPFDE